MSAIEPLTVTVELPASELLDHDNGLFVRCPLTRTWVPFTDYYSESESSLLPLVGKVDYDGDTEHWEVTKDAEGNDVLDANGQPVMQKVAKSPVSWHEVVRIIPAINEPSPIGGIIDMNVQDEVNPGDKMA